MERCPPRPRARRPTPGGSRQPHQGGARLGRVEVVFEVASERYPLDERAATLMAENLRVKAAHEPGAEGTIGARAVADAIELRLIEDTADPITLGGDEAEAVFYAPEVPNGGGDRLSAGGRAEAAYRRYVSRVFADDYAANAAVHMLMLDKPRLFGRIGNVLTQPLFASALGPGWAIYWNQLTAEAAPGIGRTVAHLLSGTVDLATRRSAVRRRIHGG